MRFFGLSFRSALNTALHLCCTRRVKDGDSCAPLQHVVPRLILRGYFRMRSHVRRASSDASREIIRPKLSDSLALHPRATPRSNRLDELRLTMCSVGHDTVSSVRQDVFSVWLTQVEFHWLILPDSAIIGCAWSRAFERGITCLGKLAR